jgi:hypothetical protein
MDIFLTSIITAIVTAFSSYLLQKDKFNKEQVLFYMKIKHEFEVDADNIRAAFMAEQAAKRLLESEKWELRSFEQIKERLGGFDDDELRKILVRAGAVRFKGKDNTELWGLIEKNKQTL